MMIRKICGYNLLFGAIVKGTYSQNSVTGSETKEPSVIFETKYSKVSFPFMSLESAPKLELCEPPELADCSVEMATVPALL